MRPGEGIRDKLAGEAERERVGRDREKESEREGLVNCQGIHKLLSLGLSFSCYLFMFISVYLSGFSHLVATCLFFCFSPFSFLFLSIYIYFCVRFSHW